MENKNVVFLTVIAIATLLTAVVGTTFAYFTATVTGNTTATATTVSTATIGVTYSDGDTVTGTNIVPGWSKTKDISVNNTSGSTLYYTIKWTAVTNNFTTPADLVYTLTKTSTNGTNVTETACPTADGNMISNVTIAAGETQSYTLALSYKDSGVSQNADQGKSFSSKLQVEATTAQP